MSRRPNRVGHSRADYSDALRGFTGVEIMFLTLHARYGPLVPAEIAARLLGFLDVAGLRNLASRGDTPLEVFRPPGRFKVAFATATALAKLLVARGISIPEAPIPEPSSFSNDDTSGPEILVLRRALSAQEFRSMSLAQLTILRMQARYGPIVPSEKAAQLLAFPNSRALIGAIRGGRVPLTLIVPQGRHKSFASTRAVANYLVSVAIAHDEAVRKSSASVGNEGQ
jgi:hypothetical protein